jgi:hypothetical protein
MTSSYEYAQYQPAPPYEPTQISHPQQNPVRHIRSNTSQPQSPHTQTSFSHPQSPGYQQTSYPPATYGISPPATQQWQPTSGAWPHYTSQPFPPAPIPDVPFNSGPGRPGVEPTTSPMDQRMMDSSPPNPDPRRNEERPAVPPSVPSPRSSRRRDKESPIRATFTNTAPTIDFLKVTSPT